MTTQNTTTTLSGLFKESYADQIADLRPVGNKVTADIAFIERSRQPGNQYHQPVALSHEQGFTYASADAGAFTVNPAVAADHADAKLAGSQILLQTEIDYEVAARGQSGQRAFKAATVHIMRNMVESFQKREELKAIYGGVNSIWGSLGRLGSRVSGSGTTLQVFNFMAGHWAAGIWAGAEGTRMDSYNDNGTGALPSTKHNTTTVVVVNKVDFTNKRLTLQGAAADLNKLAASLASSAGSYLYFEGAKGKEGNGLVEIASNTATLHNINGGTYGLWTGNTYSCAATALTFAKTISGHDKAVGKGLDETVTLYVNPATWSNLMADQAALRRLDGSYSPIKSKNGSRGIEFEAQFGPIRIKPHNMVKEGVALSLPVSRCNLVGATPMTFKVPGLQEDYMFHLATKAAWGVRAYSNWSPFCSHPALCTLFTFITNT